LFKKKKKSTSRIPVIYVFGQQPIDKEDCIKQFEQLFEDKDQPVIVMCDVEYSYAAGKRENQCNTYTRAFSSFANMISNH
jgi:diphthamide biosynthesis enzyme Dph1/Dph2-like protein